MYKIKHGTAFFETSENILGITLHLIAYYYILLSSLNDGWTRAWLGVPFAVFVIFDAIYLFKNERKLYLVFFSGLVILTYMTLSLVDRSDWKLTYPLVGKELEVVKDVQFTHNSFFPNELSFYLQYQVDKIPSSEIYTLHEGEKFTIRRQYISGNPEFGESYTLQLENIDDNEVNRFIKKAKGKPAKFEDMSRAYQKMDRDYLYLDRSNLKLCQQEYDTSFIFHPIECPTQWIKALLFQTFWISNYFIGLIIFTLLAILYDYFKGPDRNRFNLGKEQNN